MRSVTNQLIILSLLLIVSCNRPSGNMDVIIDLSEGKTYNCEVFGHNWVFYNRFPGKNYSTSMRGVAAGLSADYHNWKTLTGSLKATDTNTLMFLRECRDNQWKPMITANVRGIVNKRGERVYSSIDPEYLKELAADWVYYCNVILQKYRQGDVIDDPEAKRIINQIQWDGKEILLKPGEKSTPMVKIWQIGNEPNARAAYLPNGEVFRFDDIPDEYTYRYKLLSKAMWEVDSSLKIGPCFSGTDIRKIKDRAFISSLFNSNAIIDHITYQPYKHIEQIWPNLDKIVHDARDYRRYILEEHHQPLVDALKTSGRDPEKIEYGISEYDINGWNINNGLLSMARAHGIGDVMFTMAELNYAIGSLWGIVGQDGVEWPMIKLMQSFNKNTGSLLLNSHIPEGGRVFSTYEPESNELDIWCFNMQTDEPLPLKMQLKNVGQINWIEKSVLKNLQNDTTCFYDRNTPDNPNLIGWTAKAKLPDEIINNNSFDISVNPVEIVHLKLSVDLLNEIMINDRKIDYLPKVELPEPVHIQTTKNENSGFQVNPLPSPCNVKAGLAETGKAIHITWNYEDGEKIDGFIIEQSQDLIAYNQLDTISPESRKYTDASGLPGKAYWYNVKAYKNTSEGIVYSNAIRSFGVMLPGEEDVNLEMLKKLYPVSTSEKPIIEIAAGTDNLVDKSENNLSVEVVGNIKLNTEEGKPYFTFSGEESYAKIERTPYFLLGPGREASVRTKFRTTSSGTVFSKGSTSGQDVGGRYECALKINEEGRPEWYSAVYIRAYYGKIGVCEKPVNDGKWHEIEVIFKDNKGTFYVDGEEINSFYTVDWNITRNQPFYIGANDDGDNLDDFFRGDISEIMLIQKAVK